MKIQPNTNKQSVPTKPKIGLVLSGGGARGIAHIGIIKVLEREGIPIDFLAGTSMGGLIAAGAAAGMNAEELQRVSVDITRRGGMLRLADPGLPNGGVIRGQKIFNFFKNTFGSKTFADLEIPLALVAVDLQSHREILFREGPLVEALRATISIPGVFTPFEYRGCKLVDGGVLNNLPVDAIFQMGAEKVIAVDISLSTHASFGDCVNTKRYIPNGLSQTINTLEESLYTLRIVEQENRLKAFPPTLLIKPDLPANVNSLVGYNRVGELVYAGEMAAQRSIFEIREIAGVFN